MDKQLRQYKKQLNKLLKDQNIKVKSIFYLTENIGYRAFLKYRGVNLTKLNFLKPYVNKIFGCDKADFTLMDNGALTLSIYKPQDFLDYKQVQLQDRELLLGYNQQGYIIADMGKYPHLLISGLSNQGKSKMVNYMLKNLEDRANILVLNGFKEDYRGFTLVQGTKAIQGRIEAILKDKEIRIKPLYLILEEMQSISKDKKLQEQLKELLSMGRHYNIFVIGIIQNATKENCSFKDLFNCRCSFRQIDSSSYSVCLGTSVEKGLEQREFYFLDSNLVKGYTFSI
ncbi:MAG: hypothetical protein ACLSXI_10070 [Sarcina ventriculi]